MKKIFGILFCMLMIFNTSLPISSDINLILKQEDYKQNYLQDFELDAFSGGFAPWTPLYRIEIDLSGHVIYSISPPESRQTGGFTIMAEFDFTNDQMDQLWNVITTNDFFNLDTLYERIAGDGTFANMTITSGQNMHSVETRNLAVLHFDAITRFINALTPGEYDLIYNALINVAPRKPAPPSGLGSGKIRHTYTYTSVTTDDNLDQLYYWFEWGDGTNSGWVGPYLSGVQASASHKWNTEGNYSIMVKVRDDPNADGDLSDGDESFWSDPLSLTMPKTYSDFLKIFFIKLSEKLSFFEDLLFYLNDKNIQSIVATSAEQSGTRVTRNQCEIKVDIYIQIHGPGATVALTHTIETDIEDMWNTDKDGNNWMIQCKEDCDPRDPGCSVEFDAHVVRMDDMHYLPGFHSWYVGTDPAGTRHGAEVDMWDTNNDHIGDSPHGNDNTHPTTTGRVDDHETDNTYAHEAGHLMGLRDYYHELPLQDRNGDGNVDANDRRTEPDAGHENDIMATLNGKPLQSAIDEIVKVAGIECPCECCPEEEDDEPPETDISEPWNWTVVYTQFIVIGYADDHGGSGVSELDYKLEWDGGSYNGNSYYINPPVDETDFELGPLYIDDYLGPEDEWLKITVYAIDAAGNIGQDSVTVLKGEEEDNTPPVTVKTVGQPNEEDGYIIWPQTPITLTATDDMSGVNHIHYDIWWDSNGDQIIDTQVASQNVYSSSTMFTLGSYGVFFGLIQLKYYAVDNAQNQEEIHIQNHMVMEG